MFVLVPGGQSLGTRLTYFGGLQYYCGPIQVSIGQVSDCLITAGHWPSSEQISEVATQYWVPVGLDYGWPTKLMVLTDQICSLISHSEYSSNADLYGFIH